MNYAMGFFWLSGIVLIIVMAVRTADLFKLSATQRSKEIVTSQDTLYVQSIQSLGEKEYTFRMNIRGGHMSMNRKGDLMMLCPEINVNRSSGDRIEIETLRTASGPTMDEARTAASQIPQPYQLNGQVVEVLESIPYTETGLYRNQQVAINLRIPVGKVVVFDPSVVDMVETPDEDVDVEGKSYKMTDRGLVPLHEIQKDTTSQK